MDTAANAGLLQKIALLDLLSAAIRSHPQLASTLTALKDRVNSAATIDPATIIGIITAVLGLLASLGTGGLPIPASLKPVVDAFVGQLNTLLTAIGLPALPLP